MSETVLLLRTVEGRKILAQETCLPHIMEFAKVFKAEIYRVENTGEDKPLKVKSLPSALCNPDYKPKPKFNVVEKLFPGHARVRKDILAGAVLIRQFVKRKLLGGVPVSLKDLKERYKDQNLTDACLCNHLAVVRRELSQTGHTIKKVGAGKYCLVK